MFKSSFLKNNFIFMAGTVISGFLGYLFHFFVSRQMSVAQYGELQGLLSISIIFGVFNSALSYFVLKYTSVFAANEDSSANRKFVDYLAPKISRMTLVILLLLIVASPFLSYFLHFSSIFGFVVISVATFFSTMTVIYSEILRGWHSFFLLSVIGIASVLSKLLSGVVIAFSFPTAAAISLSILSAALAGWYLARHYGRKIINKDDRVESTDWRAKYFAETNIRRSARNIFLFSLGLILVSNLDILLVKYFATAETAGYFGAFGLLGKIVLWLNLPVAGVLLPRACADGHLGRRPNKRKLLISYGLMSIIGLGLILVYLFLPGQIINTFFGSKYVFETQNLWLFGLMSFLLSLLTLEANLSFAMRDFRVVYLLSATVILMIIGLTKYHAGLQQIVLSFSASFLIGYISILILNLAPLVIASTAKQSRDL